MHIVPKPAFVQPFRLVLVVSEDQDSFAWTVLNVEHQPPVAPGTGLRDVAHHATMISEFRCIPRHEMWWFQA